MKVYKNFKERAGAGMKGLGGWSIEGLHEGTLLGARGAGFVMVLDWKSGEIVRRIDVEAKNVSIKIPDLVCLLMICLSQVYWPGTGALVAITSEDTFYILCFDREAYEAKVAETSDITDEGAESLLKYLKGNLCILSKNGHC